MIKKIFAAISLLLLFILNSHAQTEKQSGPTTLPDVDVYDINGVHTTLRQLAKNKVLVIDCWFIPCPPCMLALGSLQRIRTRYLNEKDVCIITICMTDSALTKRFIKQDTAMSEYVSQYKWFSNQNKFDLPVYFMPGCITTVALHAKNLHEGVPVDKSNCPDAVFNFQGFPTCMVYDKQGRQILKETGFGSEDKYTNSLTKAINTALANNN